MGGLLKQVTVWCLSASHLTTAGMSWWMRICEPSEM